MEKTVKQSLKLGELKAKIDDTRKLIDDTRNDIRDLREEMGDTKNCSLKETIEEKWENIKYYKESLARLEQLHYEESNKQRYELPQSIIGFGFSLAEQVLQRPLPVSAEDVLGWLSNETPVVASPLKAESTSFPSLGVPQEPLPKDDTKE